MACYHPLYRVEYKNFKLRSKVDGHIYNKAKIISEAEAKLNYPIETKIGETENIKITPIPCGNCIGCRIAYSRDWATRATLELKEHEENYFLTITYDEWNLPQPEYLIDEKGEKHFRTEEWGSTLWKEDITKFIKDLRRYQFYHYGIDGIRFIYAGEYGDQTQRAHYHMILYGAHIPDQEYYGANFRGDEYRTSEILNEIWGKGQIIIADAVWESCAYTSRYILKKVKGQALKGYYNKVGKVPEFMNCSRRPGIGRKFFDLKAEDIYHDDEIILPGFNGAHILRPPKYYDRLYENMHPHDWEYIKARREEIAWQNARTKRSEDTRQDPEIRRAEERAQAEKLMQLRRNIE